MENTNNYFSRLKELSRKCDDGLTKLTDAWRHPQFLTITFDEDTIAAKNAVKELQNDVIKLQVTYDL